MSEMSMVGPLGGTVENSGAPTTYVRDVDGGPPMKHCVIPGFKAKLNAHSICAQESSLHTYHTENGYIITNVIIYNIYYQLMS
jgi:hypothetical protein